MKRYRVNETFYFNLVSREVKRGAYLWTDPKNVTFEVDKGLLTETPVGGPKPKARCCGQ